MHIAREADKEMNISCSQTHFQRMLARMCLFRLSTVTNMKGGGVWRGGGGFRYDGAAALSTLPAAQRARIVTVIACSAGA